MKFKELDFFASTFKELNFWQFQMMKIVQKFFYAIKQNLNAENVASD